MITLVPFSPNSGFIKRDSIFEEIDRILSVDQRNRTAAIYGLGGCG